MGKHFVPVLGGGKAAERRIIVGQGICCEGPFANNDRMDKLYGNVLGVSTTGPIAEGNESTALMKASHHSLARQND
jgi:transketolase N-terminal domain/subunit